MKLTPQQFAWMFGVNAIGLMICGRINAHIVGRLGPEFIFRRAMVATAALGLVLFAVAASCRGGFWALAVPQFLFISALGFNFSNGFALALAPFGASAGGAAVSLRWQRTCHDRRHGGGRSAGSCALSVNELK